MKENVKISVKSLMIAVALLKGFAFFLIAFLNVVWPPYGGAYLGMMTSLYPGYDPTTGPLSILIGTFYALLAGAVAGALLAWLYNEQVKRQE
jgi:hypothetical protein